MSSKRQQKVSKLLQKEISEIIQKDSLGIFRNQFVTVTHVKVSPDLSFSDIFLSLFNVSKPDELIWEVQDRKSEIRKELGIRIGKHMRIIPDLKFHLDETEERAQRINKLFSDLDIPPAEEENQ